MAAQDTLRNPLTFPRTSVSTTTDIRDRWWVRGVCQDLRCILTNQSGWFWKYQLLMFEAALLQVGHGILSAVHYPRGVRLLRRFLFALLSSLMLLCSNYFKLFLL